ncbi:MAG TPA: hypothetical protein VF733_01605 [Candidatus Saccharimonadales bacterium]
MNHFNPDPNCPPAILYGGELERAVVHEDFYARQKELAEGKGHHRLLAWGEAASSINLAAAIALKVSAHLPPSELIDAAQPLIEACLESTGEAIETESESRWSNRLPQLRMWHNFVPQLVLYKALCLYPEDNEDALMYRQEFTKDRFVRSVKDLEIIYETYLAHKEEAGVDALSGAVLETASLALINSEFGPEQSIALPALSADDRAHSTDAQFITFDPYMSTLWRIQNKAKPMAGHRLPFHAIVSGVMMGDAVVRKSGEKRVIYTWDTTKALLATQPGKYQKTGSELIKARQRIQERSKTILDYIASRPYFLLGR